MAAAGRRVVIGQQAETSSMCVSIIIEWKNQALAADHRAIAMLDQLRIQWAPIARNGKVAGAAISSSCELLFVVDSTEARAHLDQILGNRFQDSDSDFIVRILHGEGSSYYQLKHRGAAEASGNVLVFLDSDVIPDDGWLAALLGAVSRDDVSLVCGDTYVQPDETIGKTFAAIWFSLPSSRRTGLEVDVQCAANNLACPASFYREHPFVDVPGANRGALPEMRRELATQGILMCRCPQARVSHPAPDGIGQVFLRGIGRGRNIYFRARHDPDPTGLGMRVWRVQARGISRFLRNRRAVGINALELPFAFALVCTYYGLQGIGAWLTWLAPEVMRTRFQY